MANERNEHDTTCGHTDIDVKHSPRRPSVAPPSQLINKRTAQCCRQTADWWVRQWPAQRRRRRWRRRWRSATVPRLVSPNERRTAPEGSPYGWRANLPYTDRQRHLQQQQQQLRSAVVSFSRSRTSSRIGRSPQVAVGQQEEVTSRVPSISFVGGKRFNEYLYLSGKPIVSSSFAEFELLEK